MDPCRICSPRWTGGIPRARGDGPPIVRVQRWSGSDSPRSRGWTPGRDEVAAGVEGFPALAGMDPRSGSSSRGKCWIPRARGDGPAAGRPPGGGLWDSPRSRGWTPGHDEVAAGVEGFPALAGMDPRWAGGRPIGERIPRARGDGPYFELPCRGPGGDSPRSRGWTPGTPSGARPDAGFPALAGMDPRARARAPGRRGIPRARGDGPQARAPGRRARPDSPRSRGWTVGLGRLRQDVDGFPALAGMDPCLRLRPPRPAGIPRARGDGPSRTTWGGRPGRDSPRSRGWTVSAAAAGHPPPGFPALAGMDRSSISLSPTTPRIPRARGDGPTPTGDRGRGAADSPRSRGWTLAAGARAHAARGFPALAGMDPPPGVHPAAGCGIPRARGDGPLGQQLHRPTHRDSPRSRGWTVGGQPLDARHVGFPALAGMDPGGRSPPPSARRIPRARGDGPFAGAGHSVGQEDSPRSRGWTVDLGAGRDPRGGFPALAGMDPRPPAAATSKRRIPRARGDGPSWSTGRSSRPTDSPRSRGWTRRRDAIRAPGGGFPALAGMDPGRSPATTAAAGIPRARGDGPPSARFSAARIRDSPRSRGWTQDPFAFISPPAGFPALAGMDLLPLHRLRHHGGIPRARGDGPCPRRRRSRPTPDSPRSRGWTPGPAPGVR